MTKPTTINPAILSTGSTVEVDLRLPNNNGLAYLFGGNRLDPRNRGVDYMAMIKKLKGDVCETCGKKKQGKVCTNCYQKQ